MKETVKKSKRKIVFLKIHQIKIFSPSPHVRAADHREPEQRAGDRRGRYYR